MADEMIATPQSPQQFSNERDPLPKSNGLGADDNWLPKTDWSRDGIIANDDQD